MYRDQYYDGAGVASVYLWDAAEGSPDGAFAGCFLIHKGEGSGRHGGLDKGYWDSIHVVEAAPTEGGQKCRYKLTSTVMLHLGNKLEKARESPRIRPPPPPSHVVVPERCFVLRVCICP